MARVGWKISGGLMLLLVAAACCSPSARRLGLEETEDHRLSRRSSDHHEASSPANEKLLPGSVTPLGYKLDLDPNLEEATFTGHVQINLTCVEETDTVTLHADQHLHISGTEVVEQDASGAHSLQVSATARDSDKQWFIITLAQKLRVGAAYQLRLNFNGNLSTEEVRGFYRRSYLDSETKEKR